jgi:energy-coupling factor transport system permease protein
MLRTIHPLVKLVVCLIWIATCIAIFDLRFQTATILIVAAALVLLDRMSPIRVLVIMIPFALFGFGFLTTNLVFREEADFAAHVAERTVLSSSAVSAGFTLFARAIAIGMVSALFALTTDPGAFVRALMARWRLGPRVGYALFAVLQIVPDLVAEARQIRVARAMKRGRSPRRVPGPMEMLSLAIPLLAYAIRRANRAAIAMEARGLGSGMPRTIVRVPQLRIRDAEFIGGAMVLLLGMVIWATSSSPL